jgi:hypothetical protein
MARRPIFLSFYYKRDVNRVQLIRNIGAIEGQPLLSPQQWESKKDAGPKAIQNWIDDEMKRKQAVVVLIGQETASRPWVRYEIEKARADRRPLLGVHIHGISSFGTIDNKGADPFKQLGISGIPVWDPTHVGDSAATRKNVLDNLPHWIESAISTQKG